MAALITSGCGMPSAMHVRNGNDPRFADDDVRFRATYYFRVFDACYQPDANQNQPDQKPKNWRDDSAFGGKNDGPYRVLTDSLYRFKMTGKANALFNKIEFESGTLLKGQIDPFGAKVVADKDGALSFQSQDETRQRAAVRRYEDAAKRLIALRLQLKDMAGGESEVDALFQQLSAAMATEITGGTTIAAANAQSGSMPKAADGQDCPKGFVSHRGFQILGPEGWRTFDQDERLIMAMSTSAKPLISTLEELSGRVLNAQPAAAELMLPLVTERLNISNAERRLDPLKSTPPDDVVGALGGIIASFSPDSNATPSQ